MSCCFREVREDFFRLKDGFCASIFDIRNEGPCPASCRLSVCRVTNLPQLHTQRRLALGMTEEWMLLY
jgi:hypothetical protein